MPGGDRGPKLVDIHFVTLGYACIALSQAAPVPRRGIKSVQLPGGTPERAEEHAAAAHAARYEQVRADCYPQVPENVRTLGTAVPEFYSVLAPDAI